MLALRSPGGSQDEAANYRIPGTLTANHSIFQRG